MGVVWVLVCHAHGQTTTLSSSFTYSGTTYSQSPGVLVIDGSSLPVLTLTNSATTSGIVDLYVGTNSGNSGAIGVFAGSKLFSAGNALLGYGSGSAGTITISGAGSSWTNSGDIYVGGSQMGAGGTGALTVTNSGALNVGGTLKLWSGGTLTLDKGGSITAQSFDRSLGTFTFRDGTLTINGGTYTQASGALTINGTTATASPQFVLTGGATTTGIRALTIGRTNFAGSVSVLGGSTMTANGLVDVASSIGSSGSLVVSGTGSQFLSGTFTVNIGSSGTGTLLISAGGAATAGNVIVGNAGIGTATVTGLQSSLLASGGIDVGWSSSTGSLSVASGANVATKFLNLGSGQAAIGAVTISGAGSSVTVTSSLGVIVGQSGSGSIVISDGGQLNSTGTAGLGINSGSTGTATVSGMGSNWSQSSSFYVGGSDTASGGIGSVTVNSSGSLNVGGTLKLWNQGTLTLGNGGAITAGSIDNSVGTVVFGGGALTLSGAATSTLSAFSGTASLTLSQSATSLWLGSGTLAASINGLGSVTIGNASTLTYGGSMSLAGSMTVDHGSLNLAPGATITSGVSYIAKTTGSSASAVVSGSGVNWTTPGGLYIGGSDTASGGIGSVTVNSSGSLNVGGTLKLWNQGTLTLGNGGAITAGSIDNSVGTVVFGGGALTLSGAATSTLSAFSGTASLTLSQSATSLWLGSGTLAASINGLGSVTIGNASTLTYGGSMSLAGSMTVDHGSLNLAPGATITSGVSYIAKTTGSSASAVVSGSGVNWTTPGGLYIGGSDTASGGTGSLTVNSSGSLNFGGTLKLWNQGTLTLGNGGAITAGSIDSSTGSFNFNDGTLTVSGGVYMQSGTLTINGSTAASSPLLVLAAGATTSGIVNAVIGSTGTGSVSVVGGSVFTNSGTLTLGNAVGSVGTLTISGTNSTWTASSSNIIVGGSGTGALSVLAGGMLSDGGSQSNLTIGQYAGSSGTVTVSGTGSTMTIGNYINVSSGKLMITNGGSVVSGGSSIFSGGGVIGESASVGAVVVDGANSIWTAQSIGVGYTGTGSLTVTGGGTVVDNFQLTLGEGSLGSLTISGSGSSLSATSTFGVIHALIGYSTSATVDVLNGGSFTTTGAEVDSDSGTAVVTISGNGSKWINPTDLYIGGTFLGSGGSGSLSINNSASLSVSGLLQLWDHGALTLDSGGTITAHSFARLGPFSFNDGTLTVSGGAYTQSSGVLTINGSTATASPLFVLAGNATTSGIAGVSLGSVAGRQASISVLSGADLANTGTASLGSASGATGTVLISGAGSTWSQSGAFYVGGSDTNSAGTGSLTVNNTASLNIGGTLKLWSQGTLNLDTGGAITTHNFDRSTGTVNLNGGTITVSGGTYTQSSGVLTISGASNPTFILAGGATTSGVTSAIVGNTGSGALTILSGSSLSYSGDSIVASATGSVGAVTVSGTNSLWSMSGNLYVGGSSSGAGGTASLTVASGSTVYVGGMLEVYGSSTVSVASGGTFTAASLLAPGQLTNNGSLYTNVTVPTGGTLAGNGTIHGAVTFQDGSTLAPGNSPGLVTVNGDATWSGTVTPFHYAMQIADATGAAGVGYDSMAVHAEGTYLGKLNIVPGSTIDVDVDSYPTNTAASHFSSASPFDFVLVSTDGGITGFNTGSFVINSSAFELANPLAGGLFSVLESSDDSQIILHFNPAAVPEPGTLLLLLAASAPLAWRVRRQRISRSQQ